MKYCFCFVLNQIMYSQLNELKIKLNQKSIGKTLIFIVRKLYHLIEKINLDKSNFEFKYPEVKWSIKMKLRMDIKIYQVLKLIHKNNDTYSIAQLLRWIVDLFINGVKKYGIGKFLEILENEKKSWDYKKKNKKIWKRKNVELSHSNYLKTYYNSKYQCVMNKIE